uniref:Cytochrome c oxidase subunit 7A2, mitochondrial n=1 Tax=Esox lucius TaxID=8010 RepID=A0AB40E5A2_ESOLU
LPSVLGLLLSPQEIHFPKCTGSLCVFSSCPGGRYAVLPADRWTTWSRRSRSCSRQALGEREADNGIPVHLKGGAMDAILYRLTMGLTVFGTGFVVYELLSASMPKKS